MANEHSKADAFSSVPSGDASRLLAARKHGADRAKNGDAVRDRESDLGGVKLQLAVNGEIPGYHLYWENDENGAVEALLQEGFDFVTQDELYAKEAKVVPDLDISSVMSRFVKGTRTDGSALRAYLMKCPDEIWAARERQRHAAADRWDREIRKQAEDPDRDSGLRKLKGVDSIVDTAFRKQY